ncbi:hypothetical protein Ctha_2692 [Chloroherpeton thalassium ATCC 35110]|uniref:Uncharacterized protein n=1 Tax=Chloroherpeton thalassium (strain ATCC 35110 / GB-78) TaxID=517418 RepID=B3QYR8_CHLT3|nr:hypothetical protein [Chloroherpeton thalassium]ACF15141.1 hypothetical protein Ctha_2692 [Chloroherpeton thalassium ATCC 35110]
MNSNLLSSAEKLKLYQHYILGQLSELLVPALGEPLTSIGLTVDCIDLIDPNAGEIPANTLLSISEDIKARLKEISEMTHQFNQLTKGANKPRLVNFNQLIDETLSIFSERFRSMNIVSQTHLDYAAPNVLVNPILSKYFILDLLLMAHDFLGEQVFDPSRQTKIRKSLSLKYYGLGSKNVLSLRFMSGSNLNGSEGDFQPENHLVPKKLSNLNLMIAEELSAALGIDFRTTTQLDSQYGTLIHCEAQFPVDANLNHVLEQVS